MKKNLDTKELVQKYRIYLMPSVLLGLSFFMLLFVIIPQFTALSDNTRAIDEQKRVIEDLSRSINAINEVNGPQIASNLTLANQALPTTKDVIFIYSSLTSLAEKNDVQIKNFLVRVGNFYTRQVKGAPPPPSAPVGTTASLKIQLVISAADFNSVTNFSKNIYENLPLAEVNTLQANNKGATLEINFFYKPVDVAALSRQTFISGLTPAERSTLEKISQWNNLSN